MKAVTEKIDFFDTPEKAKLKLEAKKRRADKDDQKAEEDVKAVIRYDDPVRMYLREMGKVPLLDREGEVVIAKRIEAGQILIAKAVFSLDSPIRELQRLARVVEKGDMRLDEVVQIETGGLAPSVIGKKERQARFRPVKKMPHCARRSSSCRRRPSSRRIRASSPCWSVHWKRARPSCSRSTSVCSSIPSSSSASWRTSAPRATA
jgi:hypothetical protein